MVGVAKPWLICGDHGLTIVTMFFWVLFVVKPWLIFIREGPMDVKSFFMEP